MSSLLMIVAAMVEFAAVMILKHKLTGRDTKTLINAGESGSSNVGARNEKQTREILRPADNKLAWSSRKPQESALIERPVHEKMDNVSFILFPITYALFNVIYLAIYCDDI